MQDDHGQSRRRLRVWGETLWKISWSTEGLTLLTTTTLRISADLGRLFKSFSSESKTVWWNGTRQKAAMRGRFQMLYTADFYLLST